MTNRIVHIQHDEKGYEKNNTVIVGILFTKWEAFAWNMLLCIWSFSPKSVYTNKNSFIKFVFLNTESQ
jgi:hypothetical protein